MAGGPIVNPTGTKVYNGKMTLHVFITCIVAATGGLIFGYDIGISGGVTSMDSFLKKFFHKVYIQEKADQSVNQYCKFDSPLLQTFTSSLYLAALVSSLFASTVTRKFGRKVSMLGGGTTFLLGAIVNGFARDIAMLIIGRILLGVGVGFANQSVPLYLSEMAPAHLRGMLNVGFQLMITIGILAANAINYGTSQIKAGWGWRISLGLAAVPAIIISLGSLLLPDTPSSLIERGHPAKARSMLKKVRGTDDIEDEYNDIVAASEESKLVEHPWANIFKRKYRPQLTMAFAIPFFQQFSGINIIMFYAPVLFKTMGLGDDASLMSSLITGFVNAVSTLVSTFTVDRVGRRALFLEGGIQMFVCQVLIGGLIYKEFGVTGTGTFSKSYATVVLILVCTYVAGFAWSWGPLGWLVPSEIFSLEIRSAGQSITVAVNMFFTFVIGQAFLTMLCKLKFGLFFFFAGWVSIMTLFIYFFLPETKNVPIEEMILVWKKHWFWGKYISDEDIHIGKNVEMGRP
ncbi:hypothetical protein J5N97_016841 [Dioscorea zingiberensis]|uniref:Major facilitator superfamily (MFS) profile domain-containing protein n=1 Tax=Dioscorea zingiberensis TaxID=325984 RepID=A0A9D5CKB0_9LILI|nr:hypothetical protein J5N97_016841 [Dioscorea zingiberensis]